MGAEMKKRPVVTKAADEVAADEISEDVVKEVPMSKVRKLDLGDDAKVSVSTGHLDEIVKIEEWEKAAGVTKERVMAMIPPELKRRCGWRSTLYLVRASAYCVLAAAAFYHLQQLEIGAASTGVSISVPNLLENPAFMGLFWGAYAVIQGTLLTGLWVIGHECGHGAYSESTLLNDAVGMVVHTFLLVPYFAWQFTHGKHHKYTNHITKGETHVPPTKPHLLHSLLFFKALTDIPGAEDLIATPIGLASLLVFGWPLYLIINLSGGRTTWKDGRLNKWRVHSHFFAGGDSQLFPPAWRTRVNASAAAFACMVGLLALWSDAYGVGHMLKWYLFPYLVVNVWLVLYTYLHHTHEEVPHLGDGSFGFLRGALCTIDRPYPAIIDHVHLHIGSTHVLHHLNSRIPHYHAKAATEILRDNLGSLYRYDGRPITTAAFSTFKACHYVEGVTGLQFWRTIEGTRPARGQEHKDD